MQANRCEDCPGNNAFCSTDLVQITAAGMRLEKPDVRSSIPSVQYAQACTRQQACAATASPNVNTGAADGIFD